jgi:hypothetical protein
MESDREEDTLGISTESIDDFWNGFEYQPHKIRNIESYSLKESQLCEEISKFWKELSAEPRKKNSTPYIFKTASEIRLQGVLARGHTPWKKREGDIPSEYERVYELSQLPEFHNKNGNKNGRWRGPKIDSQKTTFADTTKITNVINDEYHSGKKIRTREAISHALKRYKKLHNL